MAVKHQVTPHRLLHEKDFNQIYDNAMKIDPIGSLQKHDVYGIGLAPGHTYGTLITGQYFLDCSPDVVEFGDMTFEEDVYAGLSDISWEVRTSPTGGTTPNVEQDWSPWYSSMDKVPVQQFVQFKFTFTKASSL
jgi:hypothetical protein